MNTGRRRLGPLAVVVVIAAWAASQPRAYPVATAAPILQDLHGVAGLKTLFNQDKGTVRLVLLVSPT
jgi:hypothetical protein